MDAQKASLENDLGSKLNSLKAKISIAEIFLAICAGKKYVNARV